MATDWHCERIKGELPPYPYLYIGLGLITRGRLFDWWIYKYYHPGYSGFVKRGSSAVVITKMYYPYEPKTPLQTAWWGVFRNAVDYWYVFDPETKTYYNKRTTPKAWDGYRRYLSLYLHANYPPEYTIGDLLLQEIGDKILQENLGKLIIEYCYLLLETGGFLLQETGSKIKG